MEGRKKKRGEKFVAMQGIIW